MSCARPTRTGRHLATPRPWTRTRRGNWRARWRTSRRCRRCPRRRWCCRLRRRPRPFRPPWDNIRAVAEPLDDKTAFGIDLGTTMSVVAQVNSAGLPVVLPNAEGSPTTPSVVLFDAGHAVVGSIAKESLATEPESVVQLVKRHMGSAWTFDYRGVSYSPDHVSALILRKLALDAQLLAGPVSQAAIT